VQARSNAVQQTVVGIRMAASSGGTLAEVPGQSSLYRSGGDVAVSVGPANASAEAVAGAEDRRHLGKGGDLQLIVKALRGRPVVRPAQERGRMTEAPSLQMIVLHLADALDAKRLPREVLAGIPAASRTRHTLVLVHGARPLLPRVPLERPGAQRLELGGEGAPLRHRERGRDAHVLEAAVR